MYMLRTSKNIRAKNTWTSDTAIGEKRVSSKAATHAYLPTPAAHRNMSWHIIKNIQFYICIQMLTHACIYICTHIYE